MNIPASFIESLNGILIFEADGKEFCVNNKFISEILNPSDISLNSDTIKHLVFEYREMTLKIVDSENLIIAESEKLLPLSRLLIFDINNKTFGLLVDNVKEIVAADTNFMDRFMVFVPAEEDGFISAILKFEGRNIRFLDIEKISNERVNVP